jgi:hypothetical protein
MDYEEIYAPLQLDIHNLEFHKATSVVSDSSQTQEYRDQVYSRWDLTFAW